MQSFKTFFYFLSFIYLMPYGMDSVAQAQSDNDAFETKFHLESALIIAHDNTIEIFDVPLSTGDETKSYNIECHFVAGRDGSISLKESKAILTPVLTTNVQHFVPGEYQCVAGGSQASEITVNGPVLDRAGREVWSFSTPKQNSWNVELLGDGGTWTTGPVENHPQLGIVPKGAKLPEGYSFGLDTHGNLIGVQQLGDKIAITSFKPTSMQAVPSFTPSSPV